MATDIAARGIDVEALSHVVNFDVPHVPEDYIHRVGRTARAELTGDAFTFVSPEEETDLRQIEHAIAKRLPRITVPGFDYSKAPAEKFEVPLAERIAEIRARKAGDRARAKEKAERRARAMQPARAASPSAGHRSPSGPSRGPSGPRGPMTAARPSGPSGPSGPRTVAPSYGRRPGGR